jgi:hypothetical protein
MADISGTLANRWNPGSDAQPFNWAGLLYFATDTGQVFQWSGTAWTQVFVGGAPVASVSLTGQTGVIASTLLYTVPVAGLYRFSYSLITTLASSTNGTFGIQGNYNNGVVAEVLNPGTAIAIQTLGSQVVNQFEFYLGAGTTFYYNTVAGGTNTGGTYSLNINLFFPG